ncbi:MAG: squalene/phytoene synthase family protein [Clostridia bacterium]|nr:squalene/phytoene synthase family protein [Deltaproteobacteria bacterium]
MTTSEIASAAEFCKTMLPRVSRTFALNIPVLPEPLDLVVTVAYLLCRIADTVEDESAALADERATQLNELTRVARLEPGWNRDAHELSKRITQQLRPETPSGERELIAGFDQVLVCYEAQPSWSHGHVARCIQEMARGMAELSAGRGTAAPNGMTDLDETLRYCHYVAGTVGEMLTSLFIGYSAKTKQHEKFLRKHAGAFGRALQLTNILQDIHADMVRGACWLPRTSLERHGLTPEMLIDPRHGEAALAVLDEMIVVAYREARLAFEYVLAIPKHERGIRTFCLWPLFNAVLTLKALKGNAEVFGKNRVKIKRHTVKVVMAVTAALAKHDRSLRWTFAGATAGLPLL